MRSLRLWLGWRLFWYLAWLEERPNHSMWWYGKVFNMVLRVFPLTKKNWDAVDGRVGYNWLELEFLLRECEENEEGQ